MGSMEITPVMDRIDIPKMGQPFTRSAILKTALTVPRKTFRHSPSTLARIDALESAVISIALSARAE